MLKVFSSHLTPRLDVGVVAPGCFIGASERGPGYGGQVGVIPSGQTRHRVLPAIIHVFFLLLLLLTIRGAKMLVVDFHRL